MSTREVIGALPISNLSVAYRIRYEQGEDVKKGRTSKASSLVQGVSTQIERTLIRILMGVALCVAILAAALAPVAGLPAVAFGQLGLYRLEVALLAFYCLLLLITGHSAALDEITIRRLEKTTDDLAQALTDAQIEIRRLNEIVESDNTQREVDSKR